MRKINLKFAVNSILTILSLMVIFHILILAQIIPYANVWGGRIESVSQMRFLETVALIITLFMTWISAMRGGYLKTALSRKTIHVLLWVFTAYFALNTVGNMASSSAFEKIVLTPLALFCALMFYRMALKN